MELSEKARELKREYQKEWRRKNADKLKEKNREYQKRYWEKKALKNEE